MKIQNMVWIIGLFFITLLASAVNAQVGAVLDLDGVGDYVVTSASAPLTAVKYNVSVDFWFYPRAIPTNSEPHLAGAGSDYGCTLYLNGNMYCYISSGSNIPINITTNRWYHVVETFNGTTQNLSIYINGALNKSSIVAATATGSSTSFNMGYTGAGQHYNGLIDEIHVYNRTLSSNEVSDSYNQGLRHKRSNVSDNQLIGYFSFDGDAKDASPFGNNGTFYGDATTSGFVSGNSTHVTTSGITDLNITLSGSALLNNTYNGMKSLEIKDGASLIFNLSRNFTKGGVDLSQVSISKEGYRIVFNFSDQFIAGDIHSIYVPNSGEGLYYCPYAKTISEVSSGCTNAVIFTHAEALAVTQKIIAGGIAAGSWVNASIEGAYYKVTTNSTADDGGGSEQPIPPVPEFSTITMMLALAIVLSGFIFMRSKQR